MSVELIGILLIVLFFVLIALGTISGIIRGASKSGFRLIWTLVITVILFFVCGYITKALFDLQLSFLPVPEGYEHTLNGLITSYIDSNPQVADICNSSVAMRELVNNAPYLVLNVVLFELLFWLTKWLLWPIWAILSKIFIKKRKVVLNNGTRTTIDKKRHRLAGAFIGAFMGFVTALVTVMPVVGLSSVLIKLEETKTEDGVGLITYMTGENSSQIVPYIYLYEKSPLKPILKYTYLEAFDQVIFDTLSTLEVNGATLSLSELADMASEVYEDAMYLAKVDYNNLTKTQVDEILPRLRNIVNKVLDNDLLSEVTMGVAHYAMNEYVNSDQFKQLLADKGWERYQTEIQEIVDTFDPSGTHFDEIKSDLIGLIDSVEVLNKNDLFIPIIKGQINSINEFVSSINNEFAGDISVALSKIATMKRAMPIMFDIAIQTLCEQLNVSFDGETNLEINNYDTFITNIVGDVVELLKLFDQNDNLEVDGNVLTIMGSIVDSVKNCGMFTQENFVKFVDAFTDYGYDMISQNMDANLANVLLPIIENVSAINSYENEFKIIGAVIDEASTAYKNHEFDDIQNINLVKIGEWLDKLNTTSVFSRSKDAMLDNLQKYIKEQEVSQNVKDTVDILMPELKKITNFKAELTLLDPVYKKAIEVYNSGNFTDETTLKPLAQAIDGAITNGSKILKLSMIQDIAEKWTSELNDPTLQSVANQVIANIPSITSFETEISLLLPIYNDYLNYSTTEDLEILAGKVDTALASSKLLTNNVVVTLFSSFVDDIELPTEIASVTVNGQPIKEAIKQNLNNVTSWQNEISIINDLQSAPMTNYSEYGAVIDLMKNSKIFNSLVVPIIDNIISNAEIDPNIKQYINITDNMVDGQGNLIDYNYAEKFAILDEVLALDFATATMSTLGGVADRLSTNELFGFAFVKNILKANMSVDLGEYNDVVNAIKDNISNITAQNASNNIYTIELGYLDTVIKACDENNADYTVEGLFDVGSGYAIIDEYDNSKSILLDNEVLHLMLNKVLNEVKLSITDEKYQSIFDTISSNVNSSNAFGQIVNELGYVQDNLQTIIDNKDIQTVGGQLDALVTNTSVILGVSGVKEVAITAITAIKDSESNQIVKEQLQGVIDDINGSSNPNYTNIINSHIPNA